MCEGWRIRAVFCVCGVGIKVVLLCMRGGGLGQCLVWSRDYGSVVCEIVSSNPGRAKLMTYKMIFVASYPGARHY